MKLSERRCKDVKYIEQTHDNSMVGCVTTVTVNDLDQLLKEDPSTVSKLVQTSWFYEDSKNLTMSTLL
jgi:hypothetical protein